MIAYALPPGQIGCAWTESDSRDTTHLLIRACMTLTKRHGPRTSGQGIPRARGSDVATSLQYAEYYSCKEEVQSPRGGPAFEMKLSGPAPFNSIIRLITLPLPLQDVLLSFLRFATIHRSSRMKVVSTEALTLHKPWMIQFLLYHISNAT